MTEPAPRRAEVVSRAWTRRSFDVWNEVPLVPQLTGMSCWAAAAAMVVGWRDRLAVRAADVASGIGSWGAYQEGLLPEDLGQLATTWGLHVEPPITWSVDLLRDRLERHGPLWMGEASPGLHSIVVTGIYGDGSEDGTFVRINDPWPVGQGERYVLPYAELMRNFRAATDVVGVHAQVLHAGGRGRGASRRVSHESHVEHTEIHVPPRGPRRVGARARPLTMLAAGEQYLATSSFARDPLSTHRGRGDNLLLRWNAHDSSTSDIDVVVHLHGYTRAEPSAAMLRRRVSLAGLDLSQRTRPTLALVPRGRLITEGELAEATRRAQETAARTGRPVQLPNPARQTFPGLERGDGEGLELLVDQALAWWAERVLGHAVQRARLIFTAHSGGGAALNRLVVHRARAACNPHEVHVFDGLYFGGDAMADGLEGWMRERIGADLAAGNGGLRQDMAEHGGALRVFHGPSTRGNALWLAGRLAGPDLIGGGAAALAPWYRVEDGGTDHDGMPGAFGPRLLADASASTPGSGQGLAYGTPVGLFRHFASAPGATGPRSTAVHGAFAVADGQARPEEQSAQVCRDLARTLCLSEDTVRAELEALDLAAYPGYDAVHRSVSELAACMLLDAGRQLGHDGAAAALDQAIAVLGGRTAVRTAMAEGRLVERDLLVELGEQVAARTPVDRRAAARARHGKLRAAYAGSELAYFEGPDAG